MADDERERANRVEGERIAARLLARRERTTAELRERLRGRGVSEAAVDEVLESFRARGWLDDLRAARQHAAAAAGRGLGRVRVLRDLAARGVPSDLAAEAWAGVTAERGDEAALLDEAVGRQLRRCGGRLDPLDYRRVYNRLLRAGHDAEALRAALEPYRDFPDEDPNP